MIYELKSFVQFVDQGFASLEISIEKFMAQMFILEGEIKHKLVKRVSDTDVVLTNFGRNFLQHAKKSITAITEGTLIASEQSIYDFDNQLTLGLATDSAVTWGMNCIKDFNKHHPGLRLALVTDNMLTKRMLDISTIIFWCIDYEPEYYDKLWYVEYKYGLYANDDYIKNFGEPTLENVKTHHKIIAYSGRDNNSALTNWHLFGSYGLPILTPNFWVQSRDLIVKMTAEGAGIGAICNNQEAYYGYPKLRRVLKTVNGPILKSYFLAKKSLNEQMHCNVELLSNLFKRYFTNQGVFVHEINDEIVENNNQE